MIEVKKDGIKVFNGVAVSVTFIINEAIETTLIINSKGKIKELPNSRRRLYDRSDENDIPPADYNQMFFMGGGILGKPRKEKVPTR